MTLVLSEKCLKKTKATIKVSFVSNAFEDPVGRTSIVALCFCLRLSVGFSLAKSFCLALYFGKDRCRRRRCCLQVLQRDDFVNFQDIWLKFCIRVTFLSQSERVEKTV